MGVGVWNEKKGHLSLFVEMGLGLLGVIDMIDQMGLGVFVEMGLGVLGVIDMIEQIYDSYDSSTHIYRSTHKI